jgi:hypothetical protein
MSISQEIKRGSCLSHKTEVPNESNEPTVIKVEGDRVFYVTPDSTEVKTMTLTEAKENYTVVDVMEEEDLEDLPKG